MKLFIHANLDIQDEYTWEDFIAHSLSSVTRDVWEEYKFDTTCTFSDVADLIASKLQSEPYMFSKGEDFTKAEIFSEMSRYKWKRHAL